MEKECCDINEIVQSFYDYLKSYILKKTRDNTVAEDIVQEVMVNLVESHKKGAKINNIKAWLFQVTRNTIADYYKKHQLVYNFDAEWKEDNLEATSIPSVLASDFIIPMIKLLPKKYATPLLLSDIRNTPQNDIATELNLSLSATKMRIQRARVKLQELFVECCHIEYDKKGNFTSCNIKDSCEPLHRIEKNLHKQVSN